MGPHILSNSKFRFVLSQFFRWLYVFVGFSFSVLFRMAHSPQFGTALRCSASDLFVCTSPAANLTAEFRQTTAEFATVMRTQELEAVFSYAANGFVDGAPINIATALEAEVNNFAVPIGIIKNVVAYTLAGVNPVVGREDDQVRDTSRKSS